MNPTQTYYEVVEKNKQLEASLALYTITKAAYEDKLKAVLSSINRAGLIVVKTTNGYELCKTPTGINTEST